MDLQWTLQKKKKKKIGYSQTTLTKKKVKTMSDIDPSLLPPTCACGCVALRNGAEVRRGPTMSLAQQDRLLDSIEKRLKILKKFSDAAYKMYNFNTHGRNTNIIGPTRGQIELILESGKTGMIVLGKTSPPYGLNVEDCTTKKQFVVTTPDGLVGVADKFIKYCMETGDCVTRVSFE
jgi:hypothetical protein